MTTILKDRTGFTATELTTFYREGKSITPTTALDKGVISEIKEVGIGATSHRLIINCQG
jgi:hypothetical protein